MPLQNLQIKGVSDIFFRQLRIIVAAPLIPPGCESTVPFLRYNFSGIADE